MSNLYKQVLYSVCETKDESLLEVLDAYPEFAEDFNKSLEITFNLRGVRTNDR